MSTEFEDRIVQDENVAGLQLDDLNVADVRISDTNASHIEIADANISTVGLTDCSLIRVVFHDCQFRDVEMVACDLEGLRIDGVPATDLLAAYRQDPSAPEDSPEEASPASSDT